MLLPLLLPSVALAAPDAPSDARGAFAVYCAETCAEVTASLPIRSRPPALVRSAGLTVERWSLEEFGIPDAEQRSEWGRGDLRGLGGAQDVLIVSWAAPIEQGAATVAAAGRAALSAGQWFEDLDTGTLYDAAQFAAHVARYEGDTPDVTALTLIEGVPTDDGGMRLVTRGLGKVGLPELVHADITEDNANAAGLVLTTAAQQLYEQGLQKRLLLQGATLRSPGVRDLTCGVQGSLSLSPAEAGPDDPLGPLSLVQFDGAVQGCTPAPATSPAPVPEQMRPTTLEEAQAQALARLQGPVRDAFVAGLPPAEALLIKAPFEGPRGRVEWMWVRVSEWRTDGTLIGTLANQPSLIADLSRGDTVQLRDDSAFDYLWVHPDGAREGNTTAAFLRQ